MMISEKRRPGSIADYLELTKPRLSSLVLMTTGVGFWLGLRATDDGWRLAPVLLCTTLVVGGANALNQWSERSLDALMDRTKHRPLPSGRLTPEAACRFGSALSFAGIAGVTVLANPLAGGLAAIGWASYVLVYTPLKRRTPLCTLVGAIPGAIPPMIGWAAARHALGLEAWVLFAILFLWQLPHFLALASLYREDYARAGFRMLPMLEPRGMAAARQTACYGFALLPVSLLPTVCGVAGSWYFCGAAVLGLGLLLLALRAAWLRSPASSRQLFQGSVVYLPILLILLAMNRAPWR